MVTSAQREAFHVRRQDLTAQSDTHVNYLQSRLPDSLTTAPSYEDKIRFLCLQKHMDCETGEEPRALYRCGVGSVFRTQNSFRSDSGTSVPGCGVRVSSATPCLPKVWRQGWKTSFDELHRFMDWRKEDLQSLLVHRVVVFYGLQGQDLSRLVPVNLYLQVIRDIMSMVVVKKNSPSLHSLTENLCQIQEITKEPSSM